MSTILVAYSGALVDLANPDPATITIEDVAHALAAIARFGGHTSRHHSVCEHSHLVADEVRLSCLAAGVCGPVLPGLELGALLHDAAEAYTGDLPTPLRVALGRDAARVVATIESAVRDALVPADLRDVVPDASHPAIRAADAAVLELEIQHFYGDRWPRRAAGREPLAAISTYARPARSYSDRYAALVRACRVFSDPQ